MLTVTRDSTGPRFFDLFARGIAFLACGALWWTWVSLAIAFVLWVASSPKLDVTPAVLLAGAAVGATMLIGIGLVLTQLLFARAYKWTLSALLFLRTHERAIVRGAARAVIVTAAIAGACCAVLVIIALYLFGISQSVALIVTTADHIGDVTMQPTIESTVALGAAFARMYVAASIFFVAGFGPYVAYRYFASHHATARR